ncbi:MAG TPA: ROK family protein, partial [Acidimicrobiales bacterium]|nr:ROK family protein [Acidimicrobiales bacterium]
AAAKGDSRALSVVRREAHHVARAVTAVMAVVDPELVILGGGIGQAPGFAEAVIEELRSLAPFVPELRASALGDDAVVFGCVSSGMDRAWRRVLERA